MAYHHHSTKPSDSPSGSSSSSLNREGEGVSPAQWYSGITQLQTEPAKDLDIQIVDKGLSVEFILPRRTAQFTEISVLDTQGKPIWKTQAFNKNTIVWHKQTTFGGKVPKGTYTFRMKQGNRQVDFPLNA